MITKLGNSSVTYQLGIFRLGETDAVAQGHFTHVYVARGSPAGPAAARMARALVDFGRLTLSHAAQIAEGNVVAIPIC
jgi:acyl-CoA thioesterase FadM